mmetsp:Transcript_18065/g.30923  ORF Transcript_18065/g.30923 Transcript_18065/m.30923 type:complete len:541 (-) Transcript_18065:362-1984(-)
MGCTCWALHAFLLLVALGAVVSVPTVQQLQIPLSPSQDVIREAWNQWHGQLANIQLDGRPLLFDVHPDRYGWSLTPAQLKRALVTQVKGSRLRRLVRNLLTGKPVKLGVIGTSVSWGTGPSKRGSTDWISMLPLALTLIFPKANVTARNGCFPGTGSGFSSMCLQHMVPPDVDLVVMEFLTNDFVEDEFFSNPYAVGFERLIRKALKLQRRPGVVLLQVPAWGQMFNASRAGHKHFHQSAEELYGVLGQYYQLPILSFRNAWWHDAEGLTAMAPRGWDTLTAVDQVHPNDLGHRCMLDMFLWLLVQTALDLHMLPISRADSTAIAQPVPVPMYPGNYEEPQLTCLMEGQLTQVVDEPVSQGWALVNEGTVEKKKIGFVSIQANTTLTIHVDMKGILGVQDVPTLVPAHKLQPIQPNGESLLAVGVSISYLKSYTNMGIASWSCVHGCDCTSMVLDAHHAQHTSTTFVALSRVTATENQCTMHVTILSNTSSGGHKFKVSSLMLGRWGSASLGYFWTSNQTNEWNVNDMLTGAFGKTQIDH